MRTARMLCKAGVVATLGGVLLAGPAFAEKMNCSSTRKSKEILSKEAIKPGDRPDRELVQSVRIDIVSSSNPEFDGTEQTVYGHSDLVGGTGTHGGYSVQVLKSGETMWTRYEGVTYKTGGGDRSERRFDGVFRFIAGTGKYKAIRGGGHYPGRITAAGLTQDAVCEAQY
jgi:hypothetical protein